MFVGACRGRLQCLEEGQSQKGGTERNHRQLQGNFSIRRSKLHWKRLLRWIRQQCHLRQQQHSHPQPCKDGWGLHDSDKCTSRTVGRATDTQIRHQHIDLADKKVASWEEDTPLFRGLWPPNGAVGLRSYGGRVNSTRRLPQILQRKVTSLPPLCFAC